jgi:hydrogenase expression/formation protein HypE
MISLDCPIPKPLDPSTIQLHHGSGGREMHNLITTLLRDRYVTKKWNHSDRDGATYPLPNGQQLVFTTDAFTVTPLFFSGGNIGTLAFCGTVNDLSVMGATPIGLSLSLVIEEGFDKQQLQTIIDTMHTLSKTTRIPIVTGDTKVMQKGCIDKLIITTSGVGIADQIIDEPFQPGDVLIVSGSLGEHGATLLANRFDIETTLRTDAQPLTEPIQSIKAYVKYAQDITRGGLAAVVNELVSAYTCGALLHEPSIPFEPAVETLSSLLGIDMYHLACEGRFICVADKKHATAVVKRLQKFHAHARVIGELTSGSDVLVQTKFGTKRLAMPTGSIVPRIC